MRTCGDVKIGDSISWVAPIEITVDGIPQSDLSGWSAVCQFRQRATGRLLSDAEVKLLDGFITIEASTDEWTPGAVDMDIRFLLDDAVRSTCTYTLQAIQAVTELA